MMMTHGHRETLFLTYIIYNITTSFRSSYELILAAKQTKAFSFWPGLSGQQLRYCRCDPQEQKVARRRRSERSLGPVVLDIMTYSGKRKLLTNVKGSNNQTVATYKRFVVRRLVKDRFRCQKKERAHTGIK